jgi:mono/diheme cytochrome c family protein
MPDGQGAHSPDVRVPALADNPALAVPDFPVTVILHGRGAMPWFNGVLTPAQIAAVATYIRTHFGNRYSTPITAQDVQRLAGPAPALEAYH